MPVAPFAEARQSAAVVVVRQATHAPEMLMVLRGASTSFGASYVFPGGLVEAADAEVADFTDTMTDACASELLALDSGGLAYLSAAIRELFEETGILLARSVDGAMDLAPRAEERAQLLQGGQSWNAFLRAARVRLACDALHYFAHWVTPRDYEKRFSTRFFLTAMPPGQHASECGQEITEVRWMSARQALADAEAKRIQLPRPTLAKLARLSEFASVDDLLNWGRQQAQVGVERIRPALVTVGGKQRVVMPGDADYPSD